MAQYRAVNQEIKKGVKKAKENWIGEQYQNIDDCLKKNNSKKAYKLVPDLTGTKQERTTTMQDNGGTFLTENEDILSRWTEYCSDLYNFRATGDPEVNQSIKQTSIALISPAKPGSVARQPNQCSTAKSRKQFRNINRPWGVTVSMGERPNQRDVSSDIS